ncbi:hypothetical protein BDP81DRAFT_436758 [Colletotrichum phormii]|uniref:Uncharacterized protein n=1 Tax=Colletotrichum phormii TaxID=359342 RepID=A0AAI9ZJX9_9PEZI|nr:uncharacterized protein BDP81DRAFT_436758 [Colletotrichum phormii]KAK1624925.1 hypothetical protein BDP81DRAFT_436758 [Colletotrichum phormii]
MSRLNSRVPFLKAALCSQGGGVRRSLWTKTLFLLYSFHPNLSTYKQHCADKTPPNKRLAWLSFVEDQSFARRKSHRTPVEYLPRPSRTSVTIPITTTTYYYGYNCAALSRTFLRSNLNFLGKHDYTLHLHHWRPYSASPTTYT